MKLTKWDSRFLKLAEHIASWSKDPSVKVGAVISDSKNRIKSIGFNGFAVKVKDTTERLNNREVKLLGTIHAEENSIILSDGYLDNCKIYVWPFPPCGPCMSKIIQVGITKVFTPNNILERWKSSVEFGFKMASEANVEITLTSFDDGV